MTLDAHVVRDQTSFDLADWEVLLERANRHNVFATPQWQRAWWEEFGTGKELIVLRLRRGDDPLALIPLYRKDEGSRAVLRFVGGIDLSDYLEPICGPEDRAEVADFLVRWLATSDQVAWSEFDAHNLPVPWGFAEFLVERADHHGFPFRLEQEETSAVLALPGSWDDYLSGLNGKDRHELRRKRRRLEREHPDARVRRTTAKTMEADLRSFVSLHRGAEGLKGHFMRPEIATFFERVANSFMPLGWLRMDFLEIGGAPLAASYGFEYGGIFYLYNSSYESEARRLSPGLVLVSELVRGAIDDGLRAFDFLRGPERYKYQLGAQALPLNNVRVLNDDGRSMAGS